MVAAAGIYAFVDGEKLKGKFLTSGSDWQTVRDDSAWMINVRALLETDDGTAS